MANKIELLTPWITLSVLVLLGFGMIVVPTFGNRSTLSWKKQIRIAAAGFGCLLLLALSFIPHSSVSSTLAVRQKHRLKAVIVDHLSINWPNPDFVEKCTALLRKAGYDVDYYKGEEVTVELYRHLPSHGYKLIILRTHSTYIPQYRSLAMFTSEPYSKHRYVYEQLRNRVASGFIEPYRKGDPRYLVVTDKFVRYSMEGTFNDSIIVMMGCRGIKKCNATAFIGKGAIAYVGWNGSVSAYHTDRATLHFLEHFVTEKQTVAQAVSQTMSDVGREPEHNATLLWWPIRAGGVTLASSMNHMAHVPSQTR